VKTGALPRGLLALVGAQNYGEAPNAISDAIACVLDVTALFLVNDTRVLFGSNAAPAGGFNSVGIQVPVGEVWNVRVFQALCAAGAGASCSFAPALRANNVAIALTNTQTAAASTTRHGSTGPLPDGLWLTSGTELGVLAGEVVLAPLVGLSILYSSYRA